MTLRSHKRRETQTFTLDLIAKILRDKVRGFVKEPARPKPHHVTRRATKAWPRRYFYLSVLVFTSLVAS